MRRRSRKPGLGAVAIVVAAGLAVSGCDGNDRTVDAERAEWLVLHSDDLPTGFFVFDSGPVQRRDTPPGPREDPRRFDREGGWKTRFRRPGAAGTQGPLVVESRADVFAGTNGAEDELVAFRIEYEELLDQGGVRGRRLQDPDLGSGAVAFTFLQESEVADVRFFVVAWRLENVAASVVVSGFEPRVSLAQALALARKQERRIRGELAPT